MLTASARQGRWLRPIALMLLGSLALSTVVSCSPAGGTAEPSRTGNARVNPSEPGAQPAGPGGALPTSEETPSEGTLSSTELGLVYQHILQRFVEPVDHATLIEGAIAAIHEAGVKSNALPLDLAPIDMAPTPTGDPDRDWAAFARGYDALVGKHPEWAAKARPDWAVLRRMVTVLNDDHSLFMEPSESQRLSETGFVGVGIRVTRPKAEEPPYVVEVYRDSPAAGAGVKPGDQIVAVDSVSSEGRSLTEVVTNIRGAQGTRVVLSVVRGGQPPVDIRINRAPVDAPRVEASVRGGVIGVMRIRSFGGDIAEQVQQLLTQGRNRGARAWVIDLRGNPGGSIEAMARVAVNFIENRPVGLAVDRSGQRQPIVAPGRPGGTRFPFVVLVDRETASGAEILAAAIKEYQVAPIVGARTAGSVGLAVPQPLSDGSAVQVTISRLLAPSGAIIDKQGVQPDVEAGLTLEDLQRGDDPQFMRAVELLLGAVPQAPAQITR